MTSIAITITEMLSVLGGLIAFFSGALWLFGQIIVRQFGAGLTEKFQAQDEARETGAKQLRDAIDRYMASSQRTADELDRLEKDFLRWQADLPREFVRREDYIRNQAIIEAKQDGLYAEMKLVQLQLKELIGRTEGSKHD